MALTKEIVARDKITTLMITHDMDYALAYGDRTIMMDSGRVIMDLAGEDRAKMTPGQLADILPEDKAGRVENAELFSLRTKYNDLLRCCLSPGMLLVVAP